MKSFSNLTPYSLLLLSLGLLVQPWTVTAQPGSVSPDQLECGVHGDIEIICGTRAPEDFEVTPDGRFLIVAKLGDSDDDAPMDLFELATQQFTPLKISKAQPLDGWGELACTDSIGEQVSPHGLSLSQRTEGEWQLYVVNHRLRESMEMYELLPDEDSWQLVWHGCLFAQEPYNDVSTLPDGSFVATRPQAIQLEGENLFGGQDTGNVARWNATEGEVLLPGSEYGYPNGVLISADGKFAYISAWTTSSFHKYDLTSQEEVGMVKLDFMPDNLTWTNDGKIIAAGINGVAGNCPETSDYPCIQGFGVAEIEPETLALEQVFDSAGRALINGTSVAIEVDENVYVGSFQGKRLIKIPR